MLQTIIHSSENKNLYIYDDQRRLSMLVHPEFEKAYNKSTNVNTYYLKKYEYLKEHDFFAKPKVATFIPLEESMIRDNIINSQQIVFETTDSCNLNCTYCALGELYEGYDVRTDKKINIHHAISLLKYIFNLMPNNKKKMIYISFYGGEALLNMKFIERIVEIANRLGAEKGVAIKYSMTTNGTLIHKYIDFLVVNKFYLLVSLDGGKENNSYRIFKKNKKNSFHKVVENMDMIYEKYPQYFHPFVNFNAVLHDRNSVKEIIEFIYTRYNVIPRVAELNTRNVKFGSENILEKMYHSKRVSEDDFQKENPDYNGIIHNHLSLYNDLVRFLKFHSVNYYISNMNASLHTDEQFLQTTTCTPFLKKIFLTTTNKLLPCEKINYKYSLGSVSEDVNIDIPEITRRYNFYYNRLKKYCQICYAYRFCGTCLFHLKDIDNLNNEKFVCENFCNKRDFKNYLYYIFSLLEKYPNDFFDVLENVITE